jgi:hypothetical protein
VGRSDRYGRAKVTEPTTTVSASLTSAGGEEAEFEVTERSSIVERDDFTVRLAAQLEPIREGRARWPVEGYSLP